VVSLDPNGADGVTKSQNGEVVVWPIYNASAGGGVGGNIVWIANGMSYVETDNFRSGPIEFIRDNGLNLKAIFKLVRRVLLSAVSSL
jgi:hypothetical protein